MGHWIAIAKDLFGAAALLGAAGFFLFKAIQGYLILNLSLQLESRRVRHGLSDLIAITLTLSKGDRGTVRLHDISVKATDLFGVVYQPKGPSGPPEERFSHQKPSATNPSVRIIWSQRSSRNPHLNLSPGETYQIEWVISTPSQIPIIIESAVLGRARLWRRTGQWRATKISLPLGDVEVEPNRGADKDQVDSGSQISEPQNSTDRADGKQRGRESA